MGRGERVIVGVFCLACLAIPIGMLLNGVLDFEEPDMGGGHIKTVRHLEVLKVQRRASGNRLPVFTNNNGRPVEERSGFDFPTTETEGRVHTDTSEIPMREYKTRGIKPQVTTEE